MFPCAVWPKRAPCAPRARATRGAAALRPEHAPRASSLQLEQLRVARLVGFAEHVEHHSGCGLAGCVALGEPGVHGAHGDRRGLVGREAEHARADAAEGDGGVARLRGGIEAAAVARGQKSAVLLRGAAICDGSHRVDDVAGRQVVGVCELRVTCGFGMPLLPHEARALEAQLDACERVDCVVDAVVQWRPAASHAVVGGVDDCVGCQCGDVAAPQVQARIEGRRGGVAHGGDARFGDEPLQKLVLSCQQVGIGGPRLAYVHERAEREPQLLGRCPFDSVARRYEAHQPLGHEPAVVESFFQQAFDEVDEQVMLAGCVHGCLRSFGRFRRLRSA